METQKAYKFDKVTLGKIWRSFLIAGTGIVLTAGTYLGQELLDYIANGSPIDWNTALIMSLSALGAWVANSVKEWVSEENAQQSIPSK